MFRGRYKAILIEENSYQLQVSRYIHLNPLEAKIVGQLADYPWSSYSFFTTRKQCPQWLYTKEILTQIGRPPQLKEKYRCFVEQGLDEELEQFYGKGNLMPYLGSDSFRAWVYEQKHTEEIAVTEKEKYPFRPDIEDIVKGVAELFKVPVESIVYGKRGVQNVPRWVAMYFCQEIGGHHLRHISQFFNLKRTGSILTNIKKLKDLMKKDRKLKNQIMQYYT